jgi:predicted TIM-barrel fold metal-dependent hydrolase
MKRLAGLPDAFTKLSGFGTFIRTNAPEIIAQMIMNIEKLFGAARCMFGTIVPIENLWTSYLDLLCIFREEASQLPKAKQTETFTTIAVRGYRLP